jgi:hypothetical protein
MSVTDLRLLDPSRKDLIAALQAAAKAANFRRRTGRLTLAAADGEGLVSLNCSVPGGGGRRWRPGAQRRGEAGQAAGGVEPRAGHVDRRAQRHPTSAASSSGFVCGRASREHAFAFSPPSDEPENKSGARVLPLACGASEPESESGALISTRTEGELFLAHRHASRPRSARRSDKTEAVSGESCRRAHTGFRCPDILACLESLRGYADGFLVQKAARTKIAAMLSISADSP